MLPDSVYEIYGFLSPAEAQLLYQLASEVPVNGVIVEIGSFQGKSTVCLGLGAKQNGAQVYAIDPHESCQVNEATHYGMENHEMLLTNLVLQGVASVVRVIAMPSASIADVWWTNVPVDLLWIDGSHEYNAVWSGGKIALHDSSGHFPSVTSALQQFLMENEWKIVSTVDATTVLERSS